MIVLAILFLAQFSYSQNVGIGTSTPDPSALLDLQSTNKGMLLPRMNSTQRNLIPTPATGLLIFDTDKGAIYMYDGQRWLPLAPSDNAMASQSRTAPGPASNTGFGWRSAISGSYAAISSCKAAPLGAANWIDTVYIYEKINGAWTPMTKLISTTGGEGFGQALAISGDHLLVGAPYKNGQAGAVYAFTRSGQTWTQTATLTPTTPQGNSRFGSAISIGGAYALIGAPNYFSNGTARGTVYSFSRNISTWTQQQQLWGISDLTDFGAAIDVSGSHAIVGAPHAYYNGVGSSGIAYYFRRDGGTQWTATDTIYNPNPTVNDLFGFSVAVNETINWAFISRPGHLGWNSNTGEVHTYNISATGAFHLSVLRSPAFAHSTFQDFGYSLGTYNDYLVIGVPGVYNDNAANGRIYIYKYDGTNPELDKRWMPWKMIKDESIVSSDFYSDAYGVSVYINGTDIIAGNPGANNYQGKVLFLNIF